MKIKEKLGTLWGVGIGPGDPELLTLKAVRVIEAAGVVAVPTSGADGGDGGGGRIALSVVKEAVPLEGKELVELVLPMTRDPERLAKAREKAAGVMAERLSAGTDVAFITIGDPLFYSTFSYLVPLVTSRLPELSVKVVPGVSSVGAAASAAGLAIAEGDERVAVVPASGNMKTVAETLKNFDTIVLMKVKSVMDELIDTLVDAGFAERAVFIKRAGWPEEEVVRDITTLKGTEPDYFSMVIVRKGEDG
ncbi:MAG: precorrin-2 C(20)-methyltransferase [Thermodesulfobacteriota bacterium]